VPGELAAGITRLVSLLPPESRRDLRRLLAHELAAPAPELERGGRLDLLCDLMERAGGEVPTVEDYEHERSRRGDHAPPSAATLSRRYGGWIGAVSAAAWLAAGGSGQPPARELREPQSPYSRAEALLALESCHDALGGWPTPSEYEEWARLRRRLQRRFRDGRPRTPGLSVFGRLFGGITAAVAAGRNARMNPPVFLRSASGSGI
jgi:hypothetical protein